MNPNIYSEDRQTAVGLEKDANFVLELLFNTKHWRQMFISILGESGIGKRTLSMKIFYEQHGMDKFEVVVWFIMPSGSSMENLLEQVYSRAYQHLQQQYNLPAENAIEDISGKLTYLLTGKRYLIILGGISSKTILNCVRACLPEDNVGSRVVLILEAEYEDVARYAATLNLQKEGIEGIHRMSRLDAKTSGELFRCMVYPNSRARDEDTEQIKYEEDVFDLTQGHPLAIVVIAGLLRYKEKPFEWDAVLQELSPGPGMEEAEGRQDNPIAAGLLLLKEKSDEWKTLQQQMTAARETKLSNRMVMERILSMSFDDLRQDIKSCFLYFLACPVGVVIRADHIVRMWTAEGFIKPDKDRALEEVGHSYLEELVSRYLVELVSKNAHGGVETVVVHSRLMRFLQSEAREASFIEVHDRNDILAPASVRRLSIQNQRGTYTTSNNKFPKLRSFICRVVAGESESQSSDMSEGSKKDRRGLAKFACVGDSNLKSESSSSPHDLKFLCGSKFLRLISVQGLRLQELPHEIGDMIHLRYLRVDCPNLSNLPGSIRKLLNLQTLDISNTNVNQIDPEFWKIKTLRHVLADILELPSSLEDELADLQTLHGVMPSQSSEEKWEQGKSPLDKMTKLQSLELLGFNDADHGSALEGALSKMRLLGHLKLRGGFIPSCLFIVPTPNLRCLQTIDLEGWMDWSKVAFQELCNVRPNLVDLKLTNPKDVPQDLKKKLEQHKLLKTSE